MSSAYSPNLCSEVPVEIPEISGEDLIHAAKGSMQRANISGESGQPCREPLEMSKGEDRNPEVTTLADGEVYRDSPAWGMESLKPNLVKT